MKHFKAVTMGRPCIMGRKTWDSLPKKPLPGRTNIVLTRDTGLRTEGAMLVSSLEEAIESAEGESPDEIAIIGGADIYRAALPRARRIHLTEVHGEFEGDVHMPPFDPHEWREVWREDHAGSETECPPFSFVTLERRQLGCCQPHT
jgi:dihydrofolate reductase